MNMRGLVVAITGFLIIIYLSALLAAAKRAQVQGCGAASQESERTRAASSSKGEATKAGRKTPGELLAQNKKLSDKLTALLRQQNPPVTDLQAASQGFTALAQFVAAVHISHNLGIPFDQLKTQAQTNRSYSKAIHVLRPDADAKAEAMKAAEQAVDDMRSSQPGS
jgi:formiminotetrahydrofolate cyclodeaminase